MSVVYSENATHRVNLISYETTRQAAITAAAGSAGAIKNADIAYHRSARSSAIANNCSPAQFTDALRELGTGGG
jgi:hypothetical protein